MSAMNVSISYKKCTIEVKRLAGCKKVQPLQRPDWQSCKVRSWRLCATATSPASPEKETYDHSNGKTRYLGEYPTLGPSHGENAKAPGGVVTTFKWPAALGGEEIAVIGSFNKWSTPLKLPCTASGDFVRSLTLTEGEHVQYKFLVDNKHHVSPCEPSLQDSSGRWNNHRYITSTATFTWRTADLGGEEVFIAGDWSGWGELIPLSLDPRTGLHSLDMSLPPGQYTYQYLVDGEWNLSPDAATACEEDGHISNTIYVAPPTAFRIFYATGWKNATMKYKLKGTERWSQTSMYDTPSRSRPKGGRWLEASVLVPHDGRNYTVEFYVVNAEDEEQQDKPYGGGNYICSQYGSYKLRSGELTPFLKASQSKSMLVADLDGTMIGEGNEAEAALAEFRDYWEESAALAGGVLVYNTGRSLGQFTGLLEAKAGLLPVPEVLITAVGTKIFLLDTENGSRGSASGQFWIEDSAWARSLDYQWNLEAVRSVAQSIIDAYASTEREAAGAHWLDNGSEHPHRIALSVRADILDTAMRTFRKMLEACDVQAQLITSGLGTWRYLDCVAVRAGKLNALEHVRKMYSVLPNNCMAAGDSGNDILMLGGRSPACVVGNAQPELLKWALHQPQNSRVVVADKQLARGVLEGLARHGLY